MAKKKKAAKSAKKSGKKAAKKSAAKKPAKKAAKPAAKKATKAKKSAKAAKPAKAAKKPVKAAGPKKVAVIASAPSKPAPVAVRPPMPPPIPASVPAPMTPMAPIAAPMDEPDLDDGVGTGADGGFDGDDDDGDEGESDDDGPLPEPRALSPPRAASLVTGDRAPDFELEDQYGARHRLSQYRGRNVVLFFYPKDDTPGCTTEACGFRDWLGEFDAQDVIVFGISADDRTTHARFARKYTLTFPLLADVGGEVARRFGAWGVRSPAQSAAGVLRRTFVIGTDGAISTSFCDVVPEGHAAKVLAALDALNSPTGHSQHAPAQPIPL